ncbi:hypothetical protein D3C81_1570790 [compost metagenome]
MKVLVKKKPAEPMVTARAANRICLQQSRITSSTGYLTTSFLALAAWNSGLSSTPNRIARPTSISTPLAKNGRRQPQLKNSSGSKEDTRRNAISASNRPAGLPN